MGIIITLIIGVIIGAIIGGKLAWKHAFRELGSAELRNRIRIARNNRRWNSD